MLEMTIDTWACERMATDDDTSFVNRSYEESKRIIEIFANLDHGTFLYIIVPDADLPQLLRIDIP